MNAAEIELLERAASNLEARSVQLARFAAELVAHLERATTLRLCNCGKFHVPPGSDSIAVDGEWHRRGLPCVIPSTSVAGP